MVRLTLIYALISHGTASARSSRFRGSGNQPKDEFSRKDVQYTLHHVTSCFVLLRYIIKSTNYNTYCIRLLRFVIRIVNEASKVFY